MTTATKLVAGHASYGIRAGDTVYWRGDRSKCGHVASVDYANGDAFIDSLGWGDWYRIVDLWVEVPA